MPLFFKFRSSWALLALEITVLGIVVVGQPVIALAMPPGQYGAVTCGNGGSCAVGASKISVPDGAVPAGDNLVAFPPSADTPIPAAGPGTVLIGDTLVLEVRDANGKVVSPVTLNPPLNYCVKYTADQLASAGGNPGNFRLRYYDTGANAWVDAGAGTVDAGNGQFCTPVSHLTLFAVFAKTPGTLPVTGGQSDEDSNLAPVAALFVLALAVFGAVLFAARKRELA